MTRPTLEVADVVPPVWRRLSGTLWCHHVLRAAPRPPGDRGLPDRRPGRARDAV